MIHGTIWVTHQSYWENVCHTVSWTLVLWLLCLSFSFFSPPSSVDYSLLAEGHFVIRSISAGMPQTRWAVRLQWVLHQIAYSLPWNHLTITCGSMRGASQTDFGSEWTLPLAVLYPNTLCISRVSGVFIMFLLLCCALDEHYCVSESLKNMSGHIFTPLLFIQKIKPVFRMDKIFLTSYHIFITVIHISSLEFSLI